MAKFGFSLQGSYSLPMTQVVDLLAEAGFCAISPGCELKEQLDAIVRQARARNMTVQSLHGPLRGMPAMWSPDPNIAAPLLEEMTEALEYCARLEIPLLVIHPWNGVEYTFRQEDLCFAHFDALVAQAEHLGVCVAFENLEGPEYLCALLDRYDGSKAVGFCWDSGHERCYTPGQDLLARYGHRLVMTHLNDNLGVTDPEGHLHGTDDLHLLPYHGNLDWDSTLSRLKAARRQEILNFELKIRPKGNRCILDLYSRMPLEDYFREAYRQACKAAENYWI